MTAEVTSQKRTIEDFMRDLSGRIEQGVSAKASETQGDRASVRDAARAQTGLFSRDPLANTKMRLATWAKATEARITTDQRNAAQVQTKGWLSSMLGKVTSSQRGDVRGTGMFKAQQVNAATSADKKVKVREPVSPRSR